jgi:hypothetical protein
MRFSDPAELLAFPQLQAALTKCLTVHPPSGVERKLHPDANRLATLFGLMIYSRAETITIGDVDPQILEAYLRWRE